jgi:hypothetical protein
MHLSSVESPMQWLVPSNDGKTNYVKKLPTFKGTLVGIPF